MTDTKFFLKHLMLLGLWMAGGGAFPQLLAQTATEYIVRGQQKMQQRAYTEAIEDFEQALKLNETLEEAHLLKGQSFFHLRSFPEALNAFTQAIQYAPDASENYYWRSKTQMEAGEYHLALWDAVKATKILSDKPDYYVQSGWVNFCLERFNKAAEDAQTALGYQATHAEALCLLGRVRLAEGKLTEARQYFAQAVKSHPENPVVYFHQAEYFIQEKEYNQAIEVLTASIHLLPQQPEAHFKRALLKLGLDNDLEAQKDANRAILHDRRFWKAYALRGIASYNLQEKERHEYDFRVYLTQAKTAKDFSFLAEQIYRFAKDENYPDAQKLLPNAENWALKALQIEESYPHHLLYARILLRQNKTTLARQAAQSAYNLARKQKNPGLEAQDMLAQIDRESADKVPPQIRIYSPLVTARGVIVVEATDKVTVIGQANDESGIAQVMINGNPARLSADGNFDGETILIQEKNLITVRAMDTRGNESVLTFSVDKKTEPIAQNPPQQTETSPETEGRAVHRALLFATNNYDYWNSLLNPVKDAQTIARELETIYGFKVEVLTDLLKDDVMIKIKEYARKQYGPNDQLFIFFAGHGQFDDIFKEGYVVARDSRYEDESKSSYISHSNLRTYINSIPCKHILLVMDVCFGGTIDPLIAMRGQETNFDRDRDELINRKMRYVTRRYLTSGGKEYVPDGRPGQHSPFARQLLEALRSEGGSDGVLTLSEIIRYLEAINPQPRYGEFGLNEPGSDFLFIAH